MQTLGELFIAYTVLSVHKRILKEHQIDKKVIKTIKFEQSLGVLGIILIVLGFITQTLS